MTVNYNFQKSTRQFGKVVVVTGSTSGLGAGIACQLAAEGAAVVVSGRREELGQAVVADILSQEGNAVFVQADMRVEKDCIHLIQAAVAQFGHLDVLINNAAYFPLEGDGTQSVELWDEVFDINVRGPFICCREAIPIMRKQGGGRIINIGSTVPFIGKMNRLAYGSSKGALLTMTKMIARDVVKDHILVNWVAVGWVATPGEIDLRNQIDGDGMAYLDEVGRTAPLGRLETVEDIAAGVAFLVSEEASHITGCELNISGGKWI